MFDIPAVQLLPPTPQTSQEVANYAPTTLLQVLVHGDTAPALPPSPHSPAICHSRSCSPAPDVADLRWSPHLAQSPVLALAPAPKQQADTDIEEPAAKKTKAGVNEVSQFPLLLPEIPSHSSNSKAYCYIYIFALKFCHHVHNIFFVVSHSVQMINI